MKPAHATTKASRSRCMDVIHIWNLLMLQLKHQEVVQEFIYGTCTTKASMKSLMDNSYMEPAHATTKASRSRCMDVIHIWNLLMLQLKHQEVVAWM